MGTERCPFVGKLARGAACCPALAGSLLGSDCVGTPGAQRGLVRWHLVARQNVQLCPRDKDKDEELPTGRRAVVLSVGWAGPPVSQGVRSPRRSVSSQHLGTKSPLLFFQVLTIELFTNVCSSTPSALIPQVGQQVHGSGFRLRKVPLFHARQPQGACGCPLGGAVSHLEVCSNISPLNV